MTNHTDDTANPDATTTQLDQPGVTAAGGAAAQALAHALAQVQRIRAEQQSGAAADKVAEIVAKLQDDSGPNMDYWYKEEDIDRLMGRYLAKENLHLTASEHGMILTADNKPHICSHNGYKYSLSLATRYSANLSDTSLGLFKESLCVVLQEILAWNFDNAPQPTSSLLQEHSIIAPFVLGAQHWMTLIINFKVEQRDTIFVPANTVTLALLDSMNEAKLTEDVQQTIRAVFKVVAPDVAIEFNIQEPHVRAQADVSCCGVVTTETMRRIIFSDTMPFCMPNTPHSKYFYSHGEISNLRKEHMEIDPELAKKQCELGTSIEDQVRQGSYVAPPKNLQDTDHIAQVFFACLQKSEAAGEKISSTIEEFSRAFALNEKLSRSGDKVDPKDPDVLSYIKKYRQQFEETKEAFKAAMGKDFVVVSHEIVNMCLSEANREYTAELKKWCLAHYEDLATVWSHIFRTPQGVEPEWTEDGMDKFGHVMQVLIECKNNKIEPKDRPKKESTLHAYGRHKSARTGVHKRTVHYHNDVWALGDTFTFAGSVDSKGRFQTGEIRCLLGAGFKGYHLIFDGTIEDGIPLNDGIFKLWKMATDSIYISVKLHVNRVLFVANDSNLDIDFLMDLQQYYLANKQAFRFDTKPDHAPVLFELQDNYIPEPEFDPDRRLKENKFADLVLKNMDAGLADIAAATSSDDEKIFEFKYIPAADAQDKLHGHICCVIGRELFAGKYVCYNGEIKNDVLDGHGIIFLYDPTLGITNYIQGAFSTTDKLCVAGKSVSLTSTINEQDLLAFVAKNVAAQIMPMKFFDLEEPKALVPNVNSP